MCTYASIKEGH